MAGGLVGGYADANEDACTHLHGVAYGVADPDEDPDAHADGDAQGVVANEDEDADAHPDADQNSNAGCFANAYMDAHADGDRRPRGVRRRVPWLG